MMVRIFVLVGNVEVINFMVNIVISIEIMIILVWWEFIWKLCGR